MKELVYIIAMALSSPAAVHHIEEKYNVEYKQTSEFDGQKWWWFITKRPQLGEILIAAPEGSDDNQFEIAADAAIQEALFQQFMSSHNE